MAPSPATLSGDTRTFRTRCVFPVKDADEKGLLPPNRLRGLRRERSSLRCDPGVHVRAAFSSAARLVQGGRLGGPAASFHLGRTSLQGRARAGLLRSDPRPPDAHAGSEHQPPDRPSSPRESAVWPSGWPCRSRRLGLRSALIIMIPPARLSAVPRLNQMIRYFKNQCFFIDSKNHSTFF